MALTINTPTSGAVVSGTITVAASLTESTKGLAASYLYVDGSLVATGGSTLSFSLNTTTFTNGTHNVVVKAKIKGQIQSSNTVQINVQNVSSGTPSITQSIQPGSTISGTINWVATLENITTTLGVTFGIDGGSHVADTTAPYTRTLDTTTLSNGVHTFYAGVTDVNGVDYISNVTATVSNVSGSAPTNTTAPTISGTETLAPPFSTVLDNFDRTNENPLSQGGVWTTLSGSTPLSVVSNKVKATAAYSTSYRSTSYTDTEAFVKLDTITADGDVEITLRLVDAGGQSPIRQSARTGYIFLFDGKTDYAIYKVINGTTTQIKDHTPWVGGALSNGDSVGGRVVGSALEVWCKRGSGSWTREFAMTDSSVTAAGKVSLSIESTSDSLDDFGGGAVGKTFQQGTTLTASPGIWTGSPTPTYTYQWLRCDTSGANGVAITGATSSTYTLLSADVGSTIRVRVRATNSAGTATADSAATPVIIASAAPPPPPPPTTTGRGIGYLKLGSSIHPPTNPEKYDLVTLGESGFPWPYSNRVITYTSGTNCESSGWSAGITYQEAKANGWILTDANGNDIYNTGYPTAYCGDVGSSGYRLRWCQNVEQIVRNLSGCDGFYADDTIGFYAMWWNAPPAKYPTEAAWNDAMVGFAEYVYNYFNPKGIYIAHNCHDFKSGDFESNNGMRKMRWWNRVGPYAHGLMAEYWMYMKPWGFGVRRSGPEWYNFWDEIRAYHKFCNGESYSVTGGTLQLPRPIDLIALDYGGNNATDIAAHKYCLATFLLDYKKLGSVSVWNTEDGSNPWSSDMDKLPLSFTGEATKSGNVWTRQAANGHYVQVDPVAGTAVIV